MPYYVKDPKRDPNFDNHPYKQLEPEGTRAIVQLLQHWSSTETWKPKGPSNPYLWFLVPQKARKSHNRESLSPLGKLILALAVTLMVTLGLRRPVDRLTEP